MSTDGAERRELRVHARKKACLAGIVMLGGYAIPCTIVNLSKFGARVTLHKSITLPRRRTRLTCARFGRIAAEVVWQNGMDVGLKFAPTPATGNRQN